MKRPLIALTLALTAGSVLESQAEDAAGDTPNPNWFSFGPQFGLNLNTKFKYAGTVGTGSAGPAGGGGLNRNYNDGFVRVDSSGDQGGQTWNWGYQNASQVQGNTLTMHSASANVSGTQNDDPHFGFDLAYGRDLGKVLNGTWGLQAAFDFTAISVHDNNPLSGTAKVISDAYTLDGVIPPPAPYSGTAKGPGPLLNDTPTRTIDAEAVVITGHRTLDAQLYALRLGPYYELPFGKGWSGRLSGGLAVAAAESRYTFNETLNLGGGITLNNAGSSSDLEFRAGGFAKAQLLYAFTRHWSGFVGAQYEYLGTFSQTVAGEQAQLNLNSSVYVLCGVQVRF